MATSKSPKFSPFLTVLLALNLSLVAADSHKSAATSQRSLPPTRKNAAEEDELVQFQLGNAVVQQADDVTRGHAQSGFEEASIINRRLLTELFNENINMFGVPTPINTNNLRLSVIVLS